MSDDKNVCPVAVDDGYAQMKVYGRAPDGSIVKGRIRSSVRAGRSGIGSVSGEGMLGLYNTEEVGAFTISEDIESENTQFDTFHTSPMNRALVNHAIRTVGDGVFEGQKIRLTTGLPVSDYFTASGFKNDEKIALKVENLMKPIQMISSGLPANIVSVDVGCQAVAAWYDYALDDNLELRNDVEGEIAIIDVGGRTTDIAIVIDGKSVDHQRSRSTNTGVLNVYNDVSKGLNSKFGLTEDLKLKLIDTAVRTGQIKLWNEVHDVSDIVNSAKKVHQDKIAREVERRINNGATMSAIVFVGGGSSLFSSIAGEFRNGVIVEDPEFANARGLFKFALGKSQA
jgi:plasmid segregation protein ParM